MIRKLRIVRPVVWLALFAAYACPAQAASCPNEQARLQSGSSNLAECRAYERVSPQEKNGGDVARIDGDSSAGVVQASEAGDAITYVSLAAFGSTAEGAPIGSQYISTRTATNWNTRDVTLPLVSHSYFNNLGTPYKAFTPTLSEGLLPNGEGGITASHENPPLGGAPAGYKNFYMHNFETGETQAVITAPPPAEVAEFNLKLEGAGVTPDLRHVVLISETALTPGASPGRNLFEFGGGKIEAVNVPPNPVVPGETLPEAKLGTPRNDQSNTVSEDGSRVFWSEPEHNVFARLGIGTSAARTVQLDAAIGGGSTFLTASRDGSKVFLSKGDLYEYDVEHETLTDLGSSVNGILGASDDGSYLYFVNGEGELEVWHAGTATSPSSMTPIARLAPDDEGEPEEEIALQAHDWDEELWARTARVSSDGRHVVFMSNASLTGYDNAGEACTPVIASNNAVTGFTPGACQEVYTYEVGDSAPTCVSCDPSGAPPRGPSVIPGGTDYGRRQALYASRVLSTDGSRVFFDSYDSLVAADTNGQQDVYEWTKGGTHGCVQSAGCVSLISPGTGAGWSSFVDASASGDDVFFLTRQQLAGGDTDEEVDVYDARVDGGFAQPPELACTGTGCQGVPGAQPIFATPATQTFDGVGNFAPPAPQTAKPKPPKKPAKCAKGFVKKKKKCVKTKRKKQAKKKAKKAGTGNREAK